MTRAEDVCVCREYEFVLSNTAVTIDKEDLAKKEAANNTLRCEIETQKKHDKTRCATMQYILEERVKKTSNRTGYRNRPI